MGPSLKTSSGEGAAVGLDLLGEGRQQQLRHEPGKGLSSGAGGFALAAAGLAAEALLGARSPVRCLGREGCGNFNQLPGGRLGAL